MKTASSLKALRRQIEEKDREIVALLNERSHLTLEIGKIKDEEGLQAYDPSREHHVHHHISSINEGPLPDRSLLAIYREIISACRSLQTPLSVACLGPEASFSHLAAQAHFGKSTRFVPCGSISDVFDSVERKRALWGVVPVENSLEGTVKATLDRLLSTPLGIRAEIFFPVHHCLISSGTGMDRIGRIYSHSQALAQCQGWLKKHLPNASLHAVESTARAVAMIAEIDESAAIGSSEAATLGNLTVLCNSIEDHPSNVTRFLVIGEGTGECTGSDKTSVLFGTHHEPGALYRVLQPFAAQEINMVKIESYPLRDRMWEYLFFVDFVGSVEEERIGECLENLRNRGTFFKILGSYPRGDAES